MRDERAVIRYFWPALSRNVRIKPVVIVRSDRRTRNPWNSASRVPTIARIVRARYIVEVANANARTE